ncbi:ranGTP-binding protein [Hirsutella rhossiliensis]|uniref:RanGTP-binding protein n=1 Tax=Hirsutella rhossiliensis TaxID=111463 RepID=A0A9P8MWN5_9HYPO|nr:ranGTP-binding protein [Hirsutella rhossiliensis]KAH0961586.1 ranGTP-binding protein [Hirsutella rhossiliensis]
MDEFLATVGVQAMRYAIRSGVALTSTYALGQCSRLLKSVDDKKLYAELKTLQTLLDSKMKVITPAIDLVELKSGRGNVFLESAVPLTKSLHQEIISLGRRIALVVAIEDDTQATNRGSAKQRDGRHASLCHVMADMRSLLDRIDREIPLLQLAITASGESLSTSLPASISPSRLLQIGPAFNLSLYMLFLGHASIKTSSPGCGKHQHPVYGLGHDDRKPLWQEVIHKARVRLCRSAQSIAGNGNGLAHGQIARGDSLEFSYYLEIIENLDDGRVHDGAETASPFDGVSSAGIREHIPIHQLSKIFYTDTGRILNLGKAEIGESNTVLLLKRDMRAARPSGAGDDLHFDPEWIALEVWEDNAIGSDESETDGGSESEAENTEDSAHTPKSKSAAPRASLDLILAAQIRNLSLQPSSGLGESRDSILPNTITSSLSLIEMLIRLAGLQEFQQASHLSIPDHILTFFLEETSTTGLSGEARRTVRSEAKRRVGFDPYTDTPAD